MDKLSAYLSCFFFFFFFLKFGINAGARSLVVPLLVIAVIFSFVSGSLYFSNNKRQQEFPKIFAENSQKFVLSEKKRVEDFQYQYMISKIIATICFAVTLAIFWLTKNPTWLGVTIALPYFGLAGLVIDYFSEERFKIYYSHIFEALKNP